MPETPIFDDLILKKLGREIKEIFDKKKSPASDILFEVSFKVFKNYNEWKIQYPKYAFKSYLSNLIKEGELNSKSETLKLAYKVPVIFGDLETPSNRRLAFDSYREIVNSKLTEEQMKDLRKEAEDYKYSGYKIRAEIKKILGSAAREGGSVAAYKKHITFIDNDHFLATIDLILENKKPQAGDQFILQKLRNKTNQ